MVRYRSCCLTVVCVVVFVRFCSFLLLLLLFAIAVAADQGHIFSFIGSQTGSIVSVKCQSFDISGLQDAELLEFVASFLPFGFAKIRSETKRL